MMHEWKSQERLILDLDKGDPDMDPLQYKIFLYEKNEWDNVPQVIPRFQFHLQRYMRGMSQVLFERSQDETTEHLRADTFQHFPILHGRIDKEVEERTQVDAKVQEQIEELHLRIDKLYAYNQRREDEVRDQAREAMLNDKFLARGNIDGYDTENPSFGVDYSDPLYHAPRMLTVKQVRDLFYSLWNNTVSLGRIATAETNISKLDNKCLLLKLEDDRQQREMDQHVDQLQKLIAEAQSFSQNLKSDCEKRFADFWSKNQMNVESIRKLNKQIEEHKHFQETIATRTETISSRLTKTKDTIIEELKAMKNETTLKIEQTDKFFNEQVETL